MPVTGRQSGDHGIIAGMKYSDPEFVEAVRLIAKFMPESRSRLAAQGRLRSDVILEAMAECGLYQDWSCDPCSPGPDLGLRASGGVNGTESAVYRRLLAHTGFRPKGRVVVVPDIIWSSTEERPPFVCDTETLPVRLHERDVTDQTCLVFDGSSDNLLVYETGEALLLDHDQRFFWARSKQRSWP